MAIFSGEEKPLRFLKLIEKPVPRPPTPQIPVPDKNDEERELAVIYLQKILRGKAVQNMMYDGKQEKIVLIKEVASTHALQIVDQADTKLFKQRVMGMQRQRHLTKQADELVEERVADEEARIEVQEKANLINELAYEMEEKRTHVDSENIVAELVHGFLIPETQKVVHRDKREYLIEMLVIGLGSWF